MKTIKKIMGILVLTLVLVLIPKNVSAEENNEFGRILKDGKVVITDTSLDTQSLLFEHLDNYKTETTKFNYYNCNEEYTTCTIKLETTSGMLIEEHVVEIEYKEEFSEEFSSLLTNGVLNVKTIKPTNNAEAWSYLYYYIDTLSTDDYLVEFYRTTEDYTYSDILMLKDGKAEMHKVKMSYIEPNTLIKTKLDTYIKKLEDKKITEFDRKVFKFDLIDLEMINYYATTKSTQFNWEKLNEMLPYSQTIREIYEGSNYKYDYQCEMGSDEPFYSYAEGGLMVLYNDIYYGLSEAIGTSAKNILYVPSETEKTTEAFIKAAENKIKEYMPHLNVKISAGPTFQDYEYKFGEFTVKDVTDTVKDLIDINKTVNNVFVVDFGDFKVDFLIVADSTKTVKPEFVTYDINTNIQISSTSSQIPLDTKVQVEKLVSGTEYEKIVKILNVEENEMFDIKLYSNAKEEYITKLDNGKFEVKIPLTKELEGKTLVVYYVDEKDNVTEHEVTVKDGFAIFTTDHFSIYTLAEKTSVTVPKTFDNLTQNIIMLTISGVGLIGLVMYKKRKTN